MGFYDEDEFEDSKIVKQDKQLVGYDFYTKEEIYEGDDYLTYKGHLYLRDNYLQASLNVDGNFIDPEENEE
jgi:hypothetical protein